MGQGFRENPLWIENLFRFIDIKYEYFDVLENSILYVVSQNKASSYLGLLHKKLIEDNFDC